MEAGGAYCACAESSGFSSHRRCLGSRSDCEISELRRAPPRAPLLRLRALHGLRSSRPSSAHEPLNPEVRRRRL